MFNRIIDHMLLKKYKKSIFLFLIIFFVFCALLIDRDNKPKAQNLVEPSVDEIDTFIPSGFVLVPIEIQNRTALDSIIGQYGVIDLYIPGHRQPLARGLKLIRSPRNPSQFAVLVNDQLSRPIVQLSHQPFQVVVQNPRAVISEKNNKPNTPIQWED